MRVSPLIKKFFLYLTIGIGGLILLGTSLLFISLGGFSGSNKAQKGFEPFAKALNTLGAEKICDNGDGGHGIDNSAPWYNAYYSVAKVPDLQAQITTTAASAGYNLTSDNHTITQLQDLDGYTNSTYLIAESNGKKLTVRIAYSGDKVTLLCGVKDYGHDISPNGNDAILDFNLSLPD